MATNDQILFKVGSRLFDLVWMFRIGKELSWISDQSGFRHYQIYSLTVDKHLETNKYCITFVFLYFLLMFKFDKRKIIKQAKNV